MNSKSTYQDLKQEIILLEQQLREKKQEAAKISGIYSSDESSDLYRKQLLETNQELIMRSAEEFSKVGIIDVNFIEDKAVWTREVDKMFEIEPDNKDDLYDTFLSRLDDRSKEVLKCEIDNLKLNGEGFEMKTVLHFSDRESKFVVMAFSAIEDMDNRIVGMKGLVQDISPQMIEGRELDYFFNMSADLLCIANHEGYFVKLSPGWSELLGYTEEELKSKPYLEFVHPDDRIVTSNEKSDILKAKSVSLFENRYITKSGEIVRLSWHTRVDEFTNFIYSTARNVTEEREKEEQLISSLSEKKLLLREIHHRVKNNLQVISSLLSLQSGMKNSDARLEQLYRDSQNRIKSMAAIHEMFYKSESLDRMDFPVYVKKLIIDLIYSLKGNESEIELDFHSEEVQFDLDTAIPLGLIINEIITNALKHAFNGRNSGVITVSFDTSNDNHVKLTIGDNGKGVNEDEDPLTLKNETLGMLLINSLIDQIGASIHFRKNKKGVNYEILIPVN